MLMPVDLQSMIAGHGAKTPGWRNRRVLKYPFSGSQFTFQNFFSAHDTVCGNH
jgi:hypothetical protein